MPFCKTTIATVVQSKGCKQQQQFENKQQKEQKNNKINTEVLLTLESGINVAP